MSALRAHSLLLVVPALRVLLHMTLITRRQWNGHFQSCLVRFWSLSSYKAGTGESQNAERRKSLFANYRVVEDNYYHIHASRRQILHYRSSSLCPYRWARPEAWQIPVRSNGYPFSGIFGPWILYSVYAGNTFARSSDVGFLLMDIQRF